jgi:UDP-N-acetylglucosamine transferase subunit ALG13
MHSIGFERLVKKMDEIAGRIKEKVIMQIGTTRYTPKNAAYFRFKAYPEIQRLCKRARVVVAHGGTGSVITALEQGTPVIAVPRLKEYGEVIDNQQIDFVRALAEEGRITPVYDLNELENVLKNLTPLPPKHKSNHKLVRALRNYIVELSE